MQAVCHGSSKITKATSKRYAPQALYVGYLQPWQAPLQKSTRPPETEINPPEDGM